MNWHVAGVLVLGLAVLLSAFGVVVSKQEERKQYRTLVSLEHVRDNLDIEWGRLQLEQSTWSTHGRVESQARGRLGMRLPRAGDTVMVSP